MLSRMVRTQIQLDEKTHEKLRQRAFLERKSLSAVIREILSSGLEQSLRRRKTRRRRLGFVGIVAGKARDVSERHDRYLGEKARW